MKAFMDERNLDLISLPLSPPVHAVDRGRNEEDGEEIEKPIWSHEAQVRRGGGLVQ